jgi:hypothetical protein
MVSLTLTREAWLQHATRRLADELFKPLGHQVPEVKVSVGFASGGLRSHAIGQCWARSRADDQFNHIFIAPSLGAYDTIDTLAHELIHAVDDCEHKHGKEFKKIALALGMQGPMRSASAGLVLKERLERILRELPPYPHGKLHAPPKRILVSQPPKACCEICGYKVTVPKRFLHLGAPICPADKVQMQEIGDWSGLE